MYVIKTSQGGILIDSHISNEEGKIEKYQKISAECVWLNSLKSP